MSHQEQKKTDEVLAAIEAYLNARAEVKKGRRTDNEKARVAETRVRFAKAVSAILHVAEDPKDVVPPLPDEDTVHIHIGDNPDDPVLD